jgi:hypothetical protein
MSSSDLFGFLKMGEDGSWHNVGDPCATKNALKGILSLASKICREGWEHTDDHKSEDILTSSTLQAFSRLCSKRFRMATCSEQSWILSVSENNIFETTESLSDSSCRSWHKNGASFNKGHQTPTRATRNCCRGTGGRAVFSSLRRRSHCFLVSRLMALLG